MISGRDEERDEVKMRENERERNKAAILVEEIFFSFATKLKNIFGKGLQSDRRCINSSFLRARALDARQERLTRVTRP